MRLLKRIVLFLVDKIFSNLDYLKYKKNNKEKLESFIWELVEKRIY